VSSLASEREYDIFVERDLVMPEDVSSTYNTLKRALPAAEHKR
jgi:hypothetical protein